MAPELFRVSRIDCWDATPGSHPVYIIKGETVEDVPQRKTLKTVDAWKASLLQRLHESGQLAWVTWRLAMRGDDWLQTVAPDDTKFRYEDGAHV